MAQHEPLGRTKALDDLGFSRQLVFTTFAGSQFMPSPDMDVKYGGSRALNRGIAEFCAAGQAADQVGVVPLDDPERALAEVDAAIEAGCSAEIWVPAAPAGARPATRTLDPVTAAPGRKQHALHAARGRDAQSPGPAYHKNGHPRPKDWLGGGENLRAKDYFALAFAPQNFLCSLALDGVFDRFPALRGGVIELGAGWVPDMLRRMDGAWKGWRKTDPVIAGLSAAPTEFIRRAVRFTPFATEDAGTIIREGGEELFLFSSGLPAPGEHPQPDRALREVLRGLQRGRQGPVLPPQFRGHVRGRVEIYPAAFHWFLGAGAIRLVGGQARPAQGVGDAGPAHRVLEGGGLDQIGQGLHAVLAAHHVKVRDVGRRAAAELRVTDVAPVDLQHVHAQLLQVGEGSRASPEIVQADLAAGPAQRLQVAIGQRQVVDRRALGQLEHQPALDLRLRAYEFERALDVARTWSG